jgi:hypothetical protein
MSNANGLQNNGLAPIFDPWPHDGVVVLLLLFIYIYG